MNKAPNLGRALAAFYREHGFGNVPGERPRTVRVYTGCMLVPLPNIEARRKYLKYHDLHHIATGYSVGRIGEGEMSAWELGTGSASVVPMVGVMNLVALSTGLFLEPRRMWRAFERGCRGFNLYPAAMREAIDTERIGDIVSLRARIVDVRAESRWPLAQRARFAAYSAAAVVIHAGLAIPAVIARFFTDAIFGAGIFEAVKPKKRSDLY